jgi:hypothetical protein
MIYFVATPDRSRIKIGTTVKLSRRLGQLIAEYGHGLEVLAVIEGSYDEEKSLHQRFAHLHVVGEWFEPADDLTGFIASEGKSWDKTWDGDGRDDYKSAKVDSFVLGLAQMVAAARGVSLPDYLSETLRSFVTKDYLEIMEAMANQVGRASEPIPAEISE